METNSSTNLNLTEKKLSNIKSISARMAELFGDDNFTANDDDDDFDNIPLTKWLNGSDSSPMCQSDMSTFLKSPIYSYNEENMPISLAYETGCNNSTLKEEYNEVIEKYVTDNSCVMSTPNVTDLESADLRLYDSSTLCKDSKILNEKLVEKIPIELKEIDNSMGLNSPHLNNLYLNSTQFEEGALYQNNEYDQSESNCYADETPEISFHSSFEPYQSKANINESTFQISNTSHMFNSIDTNSNCILEESQVIDSNDSTQLEQTEFFDCEVMTSSQNTEFNNEISILSRSTSESEINNDAHYESSGDQETNPNNWLGSIGNFHDNVSTFLLDDKNNVNTLKQKENKSFENQKNNAETTITHNCVTVKLEVEEPNPYNLLTKSDNTPTAPSNEEFITNLYESGSNYSVYNNNVISQLGSTPEHKMVSSHDICIPIQISNSDKNIPDVSAIFQYQDEYFDNSSTPNLSLPSSFEQQTYANPSLNIKTEVNSFNIENNYEVSTNKNTNFYDYESSGYNSVSPITIDNQFCFKSEPGIEKEETINSLLKKKGGRREYSHENPFLTESDLESEDETNIENVFENFDETEDEDIKPTLLNIKLTSEVNDMPEQVVKIPLVLKSKDVKLQENCDLVTKYNSKNADIFEKNYINKVNESSVINLENADIEMQDISITRHENKYDSKFDRDSEETNYFSELIKNSNAQFMKGEWYEELIPNIDTKYKTEEEGIASYDFTHHKKVFPYYPYDAPADTLVDYPQSDDDEDYKKQYKCDGCRKMFLWARGSRTHATICKIVPQRIPDIPSTSRICTNSPNTDTKENNTSELFGIFKKKPSSKLNFVTIATAKDEPVDLIKTPQGLKKQVSRKIKQEVENSNFAEDTFGIYRRSTRIMANSNNHRVVSKTPNTNKPTIIKKEKGPIVDNGVFMFHCSNCKKGYKHKKSMLEHQESHHLNLKCIYCEKIFALQRTLNTHSKKCPELPAYLREQLNATDKVAPVKKQTIKNKKNIRK